jgi:hypothetical protein
LRIVLRGVIGQVREQARRAVERASGATSDATDRRAPPWRGLALGLLLAFAAPVGTALAENGAGFDVSYPACRDGYPVATAPAGTMIVGVNDGRAFTTNPCFGDEYRWASAGGATPALYMNVNYPSGPGLDQAANGPRGACAAGDAACRAYNYGFNAAAFADSYARPTAGGASQWWLDVETDNHWSRDTGLNAQVLQGAIDYIQGRGLGVGIYSVPSMWQRIAGSFAPGLPTWVAQTRTWIPTLQYCAPGFSFGGGKVMLVQHWTGSSDQDYPCPGTTFAPVAPAPTATSSSNAPQPLAGSAEGSLVGSSGGSSVFYAFDYAGGNQPRTVTLDFWPHGPDVGSALYLTILVNGTRVTRVHAIDTPTPGHLSVTFTWASAGPAVLQLTSYDPAANPVRIGYSIRN